MSIAAYSPFGRRVSSMVQPADVVSLIGVAAVVFSALYLLSDVIETAQGGFSTAQLVLTYISEAAIPLFVLGIYAAQRPSIGRLGLLGAVAYAYTFVFFTSTVVFALVQHTSDWSALESQMEGWIAVHSVLMVVAGLVFGYAVVRAGVLPRWTGGLLMLGMLSMVVATALPDVVQTGAAAIRDLAFAGMGAALLGVGRRKRLMRFRYLRWGATDQEADDSLPGDALIPNADMIATRAITIRAEAGRVWPWIAQLGQGRGGFYSYDLLENLVGCNIHSSDRILPEWQAVKVGDEVRLAPQVGLAVAFVEQGRSLVLRGGVPMGKRAAPYDFTWAFTLREEPDGTTRLLIRERYVYTRAWARLIVEPAELLSFAISQKMLRGIRDRARRSRTHHE